MRGIVFRGDSTLELATFPDPTPGVGEVVLEIKASGNVRKRPALVSSTGRRSSGVHCRS